MHAYIKTFVKIRLYMFIVKVDDSTQDKQEKQGTGDERHRDCTPNLCTKFSEDVAHFVPPHMRVAFVAKKPNGKGGSAAGEEQRHH